MNSRAIYFSRGKNQDCYPCPLLLMKRCLRCLAHPAKHSTDEIGKANSLCVESYRSGGSMGYPPSWITLAAQQFFRFRQLLAPVLSGAYQVASSKKIPRCSGKDRESHL
jgi:hypothetical protein